MIEREIRSGSVRILKNHVECVEPLFVIKVGVVEESRWKVVLSALWYYMEKGMQTTIIVVASEVLGETIRKYIIANGMDENTRLFKSSENLNEEEIAEEIVVEADEEGVFFRKSRAYVDGTVFAVVNEFKKYFKDQK